MIFVLCCFLFCFVVVFGLVFLLVILVWVEFVIFGFELVYIVLCEIMLVMLDLCDVVVVWKEMFDSVQCEIVFGQFYVVGQDGEVFDDIMVYLKVVGWCGVKICFLMEKKGEFVLVLVIIEKFKCILNLEFCQIDYFCMIGNGIIYVKYFVVDGCSVYVGSQNFDWCLFLYIYEIGLKIIDLVVVVQVQVIFEIDWVVQVVIVVG